MNAVTGCWHTFRRNGPGESDLISIVSKTKIGLPFLKAASSSWDERGLSPGAGEGAVLTFLWP